MGKLISKLSSKNIDCTPNVEMLIKAKDKKMHLYNIVGIVKKLVVGESSYGEYTKFVRQERTGNLLFQVFCFFQKLPKKL